MGEGAVRLSHFVRIFAFLNGVATVICGIHQFA
jgi:hypothetical protein